MSPDDSKRSYRNDLLLASAMVAAGLVVSGLSLAQIAAGHRRDGAGDAAVAVVTRRRARQTAPAGVKTRRRAPDHASAGARHPDARAQTDRRRAGIAAGAGGKDRAADQEEADLRRNVPLGPVSSRSAIDTRSPASESGSMLHRHGMTVGRWCAI